MVHLLDMPLFIRKAVRRRKWREYGRIGKRILELQVAMGGTDPYLWPDVIQEYSNRLSRLRERRQRLHHELMQEV